MEQLPGQWGPTFPDAEAGLDIFVGRRCSLCWAHPLCQQRAPLRRRVMASSRAARFSPPSVTLATAASPPASLPRERRRRCGRVGGREGAVVRSGVGGQGGIPSKHPHCWRAGSPAPIWCVGAAHTEPPCIFPQPLEAPAVHPKHPPASPAHLPEESIAAWRAQTRCRPPGGGGGEGREGGRGGGVGNARRRGPAGWGTAAACKPAAETTTASACRCGSNYNGVRNACLGRAGTHRHRLQRHGAPLSQADQASLRSRTASPGWLAGAAPAAPPGPSLCCCTQAGDRRGAASECRRAKLCNATRDLLEGSWAGTGNHPPKPRPLCRQPALRLCTTKHRRLQTDQAHD